MDTWRQSFYLSMNGINQDITNWWTLGTTQITIWRTFEVNYYAQNVLVEFSITTLGIQRCCMHETHFLLSVNDCEKMAFSKIGKVT